MNYLRIFALTLLATMVLFTVIPADNRPVTGVQHDVEHFGAFVLPGVLFVFAFKIKTTTLLLGAAAFTLMLECMQIPLPYWCGKGYLPRFSPNAKCRWFLFMMDRVSICV